MTQPPRLRTEEPEGERHATWTELFYDLAFVVAVANLGHRLLLNVTWSGVLAFIGLFVFIWWSWAQFTFYADRFDTDDVVQRLLAMVQMIAVSLMAVSISGDVADSSLAFAAGYITARVALIVMYLRVRRHVASARVLVTGYIIGLSVALVPWFFSLLAEPPLRFLLWGAGLTMSFYTPYAMRKEQAKVPLDVSHLPERFGLFTILVFGESIAAVVSGLSHHEWAFWPTVTGLFGVATATGLWWTYFGPREKLEGSVVRRDPTQARAWKPTAWIYSHMPLAIALTATAIGMDLLVESDGTSLVATGDRWLVTGGAAVALMAMAMIHFSSVSASGQHDIKARSRLAGAGGMLLIGIFGSALTAPWIMGLVTLVAGAGVLVDVFLEARVAVR